MYVEWFCKGCEDGGQANQLEDSLMNGVGQK